MKFTDRRRVRYFFLTSLKPATKRKENERKEKTLTRRTGERIVTRKVFRDMPNEGQLCGACAFSIVKKISTDSKLDGIFQKKMYAGKCRI